MTAKERTLSVDQILKGSEPPGSKISMGCTDYNSELIGALNWFSYEKDSEDARKYICAYLKKIGRKEESDKILSAKSFHIPRTYGWLARLIVTGAILSERHMHDLEESIQKQFNHVDVLLPTDVVKETPTEPIKPAADDTIQEKISEYIGELEFKIDHYLATRATFNLFNDLKVRNIGIAFLPAIKTWSHKIVASFSEVRDTNDKMLIEGYSNLRKADVKGIIKMAESFIEDCDKFVQFKKVSRKPRKVKKKTPSQLVAKMFYLSEFPELELKSISPTEVIGADMILCYNVRYKKLGVYHAIDKDGLSVQGSTIVGFDPVKSKQKVLRHPDKQIQEAMRGNKVAIRSYLDLIKCKAQDCTGRINKETILLRKF